MASDTPSRPDAGTEPSDDLEFYRRRVHALETAVRGAVAVLATADDYNAWRHSYKLVDDRNRYAAGKLRSLLAVAGDEDHPLREHAVMLKEDLQHVLNLLTGAVTP